MVFCKCVSDWDASMIDHENFKCVENESSKYVKVVMTVNRSFLFHG